MANKNDYDETGVENPGTEVAVIGMAVRFPGAGNINEFWNNLKNGIESICFSSNQEVEESLSDPGLLENPNFVKASGRVKEVEYFDAAFFGYTPEESLIMNPQTRLFYECTWEALEDAGWDPGSYNGRIGLYTGASPSFYWEALTLTAEAGKNLDPYTAMQLSRKDSMSTRVSYKLNFRGPTFNIYTTCSTSLVAIHLAVQGLMDGECEMALAGGVKVSFSRQAGYLYHQGMIESPDGHCRALDSKAKGFVGGEGAGVVVLKMLEDAAAEGDHIYALVKGSNINNDGIRKVGYTAPSVEGQAEAISAALYLADVQPQTIGYIEAHGTGTQLGDSVEIEALKLAFNTKQKNFCGIGSVKTNIGHLDTAAGAAGFIKAVLALKHGFIPPTLHAENPNPKIDLENSPFYVVKSPTGWKPHIPGCPLRAGVNSFGIGGTNAHIILEEFSEGTGGLTPLSNRQYQLILLSARTKNALDKMTENLVTHLKENPTINLANMAYTLQVGRKAFEWRRMWVCKNLPGAAAALASGDSAGTSPVSKKDETRPVVFMFPGQGTQYENMGRDLYEKEPLFRREMDHCLEILTDLQDHNFKEILYPGNLAKESIEISHQSSPDNNRSDRSDRSYIDQTEIAQPVLFAFEYALAKLLIAWGIEPYAFIGDGIGEYTAACLSGELSPEDALKMIVLQGQPGMINPMTNTIPGNSRLEELLKIEGTLFVEVGPGRTLSNRVEQHQNRTPGHLTVNLIKPPGENKNVTDDYYLLNRLGQLWLYGQKIDWAGFYLEEKRYRISLPSYSFERQRYWIDGHNIYRILQGLRSSPQPGPGPGDPPVMTKPTVSRGVLLDRPNLSTAYEVPHNPLEQKLTGIWQELFGIEKIGIHDNFLELGGDSLKGMRLINRYKKLWGVTVPVAVVFKFPTIAASAAFFKKHYTGTAVMDVDVDQAGETQEEYSREKGNRTGMNRVRQYQNRYKPIPSAEKKEYYDQSSTQKRLFFLHRLENIGTTYNIYKMLQVNGNIDTARYENAVKTLISRHQVLGTSFHLLDNRPVQYIHDEVEFEIEYYDLQVTGASGRCRWENEGTGGLAPLSKDPAARSPQSAAAIINSFIRPFDLSRAPCFRIGLLTIGENHHILMSDIHHIIIDGISQEIFVKELTALYAGREPEPLRLQYKDYSEWQINSPAKKTQKEYWLKEFAGEIPVIDLPTDFTRPAIQAYEGNTIRFSVEEEETKNLKKIAREQGTTLFMMILTIYTIMLSKISSQQDIIVGTDVVGRSHPDLENMIGMFVNTLSLRNFPKPGKTFKKYLQEVKKRTLKSLENQDYQYEDLVENVSVNRDTSRNPLFDVMFSYREMFAKVEKEKIPGEKKQDHHPEQQSYIYQNTTAMFDLTLNGLETPEGLSFNFQYCTKLFKEETIRRLITYFKKIVSSAVVDINRKISEIAIISEKEKKQILFEFNNTKKHIIKNKNYTRLLEEQAIKNPDGTAAIYNRQHVTRGELNREGNRIASLLSAQGITVGSSTAICLNRGIDMLAAIIGVLKAGGFYVPIEIDYPPERIEYMLEDCEVHVVIGEPDWLASTAPTRQSLCLHPQKRTRGPHKADRKPPEPGINANTGPDDLVYMIYTSGTTGKPKGVMIHQLGMLNHMFAKINDLFIASGDIIAQTASACFDISVWQFLAPSMVGARTVIMDKKIVLEPRTLLKKLQQSKITIWESVPSLMTIFLETTAHEPKSLRTLKHLRWMIATGEPLTVPLVKDWYRHYPHIKLMNAYGPTEASDDVTHYVVDDLPTGTRPTVPIGKPLQNLHIYILDKHLSLCPVGVKGEICAAGIGVGKGYWKDEQKTGQSFIPNPYLGEIDDPDFSILYKTGDIGYWQEDGNIQCLGREDEQVKIRGNRIELEEIRQHLLNHEKVKEAAVILKKNKTGETFLCAYVAADNTGTGQLREYLSRQLPAYMIPSYFVSMPELPLTPNGKLDRGALPEPAVGDIIEEHYTAPGNPIEKKLAALWADVLGIDKNTIGIDDNFFQRGGHSLKATVLAANIHRELQVKIPLVEMFRSPTIRGLAGFIKTRAGDIFTAIEPVEKKDYYHLSSAQKRLYILQRMEKESIVYNIPKMLELTGQWEKEEPEGYFQQLILRHESLRTSFHMKDNLPVQRIHDKLEFSIEYYKKEEPISSFIRPFDLSRPPLLRVGLIKKEHNHILIVDMHHIISDGVSEDILVKDFLTLYNQKELAPLRLQYKDFSQWQNRQKETLKQQKMFWLKQLREEIPILNLPYDYPRPAVQSFEGSAFGFSIEKQTANALTQLALERGATTYMLILALYNTLLSKITGQEDILIGTPVAGRRHAHLGQIIGMFVNTLVMRNYPAGKQTFTHLLDSVRERTLEAFDNQDYQFEELVEQVTVTRNPGRNPLFDVMLVKDTMKDDIPLKNNSHREPRVDTLQYEIRLSKFDLTLFMTETPNRFIFSFEYCTRLFKPDTIQRLARYFKTLAHSICSSPTRQLQDIEITTEEEKKQLLVDFNLTGTRYPKDKTLHELFAEQAEQTPDNIAVTGSLQLKYRTYRTYISYRELNQKSNQLSRLLIEKGIKPDNIAGIMVERSIEMIIGILAILKAGGAYLSIDPQYPEERIDYMLTDSNACTLLTRKDIVPSPSSLTSTLTSTLTCRVSPTNLAYIIYTSGSTGTPKGTLVTHRNVVRLVKNTNYIDWQSSDRLLQGAALEFDASTFEIWGALLNGLQLYPATRAVILNASKLKEMITKHKITTLWLTAPLFNQLADANLEIFTGLRNLLVGGDVLSTVHINKTRAAFPSLHIINGYGPTENTTFSTTHLIEKEYTHSIPIGKPIANSTVYILDKHNRLVPLGCSGELCVGGDGVSRGYLNNPELTAEKFDHDLWDYMQSCSHASMQSSPRHSPQYPITPSPHHPIYRTGDLARRLPDAIIEFLGRIDHQVKIRGFRVETEEIEKQLLQHSMVKEAVVLPRENKNSPGEKYLCAYVTLGKKSRQWESELSNHLSLCLPAYMIPAYFVQADRIPLTPNGKVDRKALPEPRPQRGTRYTAPAGKKEKIIAAVWKEVLKRDEPGIDDNFFEIGGNSIDIVQLCSRLNQVLGKEIEIITLFEYPTIRSFSDYLRREEVGKKIPTGTESQNPGKNKPTHANKHRLQQRKIKVRKS